MTKFNIQAVLFDLDGTLVETHIDFDKMRHLIREMVSAAGVPLQLVENQDILTTVYTAVDYLQQHEMDGLAFRRRAFQELENLEITGCSTPVTIEGASETLSHLKDNGIKIGIVTRNCKRVAEPLLQQFNIPYNILLTRDDVPRTKPDPDHLHRILMKLETPTEASVMVGDHWMDIQSGVDAGCAMTIGFSQKHDILRFQQCTPDYIIDRLSRIVTLIS